MHSSKPCHALITALGGGVGVAIMIALAEWSQTPLSAIPFTTSIVLVMADPASRAARPRNIIGGHVLSTLSGFAVLWLFGGSPWLASAAVALSILLMRLTDCLHPPAGLDALLVVTLQRSWTFLFIPVLAGVVTLITFAYVYHKLTYAAGWPQQGTNTLEETER
jgi:CBS-domain-containing membrane protein